MYYHKIDNDIEHVVRYAFKRDDDKLVGDYAIDFFPDSYRLSKFVSIDGTMIDNYVHLSKFTYGGFGDERFLISLPELKQVELKMLKNYQYETITLNTCVVLLKLIETYELDHSEIYKPTEGYSYFYINNLEPGYYALYAGGRRCVIRIIDSDNNINDNESDLEIIEYEVRTDVNGKYYIKYMDMFDIYIDLDGQNAIIGI